MMHRLLRVIAALVCFATITSATIAYGQVTTSLSGTVTDTSGAVLPGADVVAKADETGTTFTAVTNERGLFTIPAMPIGRYTVTVSLQGFKTVALSDIRLSTATAEQVNIKLEIGALAETVTVKSGTEVVQTQTNTLGSTLTTEQDHQASARHARHALGGGSIPSWGRHDDRPARIDHQRSAFGRYQHLD